MRRYSRRLFLPYDSMMHDTSSVSLTADSFPSRGSLLSFLIGEASFEPLV
jgi:hypothetical protein